MQEIKKTDTKFVQDTSNKKPRTGSKTRTLGINRNQNNIADCGQYNICTDNDRINLRTLKLNVVNKE
jgi:hypothetical protein